MPDLLRPLRKDGERDRPPDMHGQYQTILCVNVSLLSASNSGAHDRL
jgi:hypothetical protein